MKSIRHVALSALLTIGIFGTVAYTACNKDACASVTCMNGGTCSGGTCTCPVGYEGTTCDTKSNAKFVGTYTASESCGGTASKPYQVIITADPSDPTKILIANLGNYNCTVGGTITFTGNVNGTQLTINDNQCGTQMNATGTYSNGAISINYTAIYGAVTDNCTANLTK